MIISSTRTSQLVIDAGIAVWAVIPVIAPFNTLNLIREWREKNIKLISPSLFLSESTSVIRKIVYNGLISKEEGRVALKDILDLDINIIQETREHCLAAFRWAQELNQARAYDGFYLAVAEQLGTELWTTDQRLSRSASKKNINWVRWAGHTNTD